MLRSIAALYFKSAAGVISITSYLNRIVDSFTGCLSIGTYIEYSGKMATRAASLQRSSDNNVEVNGDNDEEEVPTTFKFNGKVFASYQDMVNAKRKRNQDVLEASGLLNKPSPPPLLTTNSKRKSSSRHKQAQLKVPPQQPSRRSSRLSQQHEKTNYKEVPASMIEKQQQHNDVVDNKKKRPRVESRRIVSPSPPPPPAANSVRSLISIPTYYYLEKRVY
jgi:hypothetical protein